MQADPQNTIGATQRRTGASAMASHFPTFYLIGKRLSSWPLAGMAAALLWFLVLAIGVLIPSEDYRRALGWIPESVQKADEQKELLEKLDKLLKENFSLRQAVELNSEGGVKTPPKKPESIAKTNCTDCGKSVIGEVPVCYVCKIDRRTFASMFWPFLIASVSFLPLNICLLTLFAAFIGGCALNKGELRDLEKLVAEHDSLPVRTPEGDRDRKRLNYLREHPGYSALRGLIVFLVLVSGLLIASGTSFILEGSQTEQLTQYFRLAGLFSFFGYLAGSDPTVFASMIEFGSARLRTPASSAAPAPTPSEAGAATATATATATGAAAATAAAAKLTAEKAEDTVDAINAITEANAVKKDPEEPPKVPPEGASEGGDKDGGKP